ncbi:MAG TPA: NAD-dependent epimerase/dehydratase family protein [Gemmataceae bacterium]|nr:NAD-dependent epimerase/dehydratase family protein [Gemmataceae bacterium]
MNTFDRSHILVVGGAGFVGSNLVRELIATSSAKVLIVDNLLSAERSNVPIAQNVDFIQGSITHDAVLKQLPRDLDYVFHLSTYHGNQNSMADPLADHENNTYTTIKLYDHLKTYKLKKVVYSSAGCTVAEKTYGEAKATTEDDPVSLWLDTPYQISKIIGEFYSNYYFKAHKLPVVKARFQNVYGPGEILGAGQWRGTTATVWRNVIPTFIYRAIKQMPLRVDNGGIASRDFIYARDIARGLMHCAAYGEAGEAYNVASGEETSILDLANLINEYAGNRTPLDLAPKRSWDRSGKRFGSTEKAKEKIQFSAEVALKDGLRQTVQWTKDNLALIEACIAKHSVQMASAAA